MKKHFVTFLSPGSFVHEETTIAIDSWDVEKAKELAHGIRERYGATPFAFVFTTRSRKAVELDSKEVKRSGRHYLGGRVMTLEEVKREMPDAKTLISNMEWNDYARVIVNDNSWRTIQPLDEDDVVLAWDKAAAPSA
jgi:hypothetical protein